MIGLLAMAFVGLLLFWLLINYSISRSESKMKDESSKMFTKKINND